MTTRLLRSLLLLAVGGALVGCGGDGSSAATGAGGTSAGGTNGLPGTGGRGGAAAGQGGTGGAATGSGGAAGSVTATGGSAGMGAAAGAQGSGGTGGGGGATSCPTGNEGCACYGNGTCNTALSCLSQLCVNPTGSGGSTGGGGGATGCPTGREGCACYGNGTCNTGLSCLSLLCVNATGSGGASGAGGAAGAIGTGGTTGTGGAAGSGGTTGTGGMAGSGGATGSGGVAGSGGTTGTGGMAGSGGAAGTGASGASGSAGASGMAGSPGTGGATGGAGGSSCQSAGIVFTPRTPTVLILVDRSGSSFTTETTGAFFNVRSAVEDAIASVDGKFRLGFAAFVGQHTGTTCGLVYDSVPFATSNAVAIRTEYDMLGPLQPYATAKAESPATEALPVAQAALAADPGTAGRYLLFITTGASDFCDDANTSCPPDAVTYQLQQLWAGSPSIQTLVVGLPAAIVNPVAPGVLQDFANAGTGQAVAFPTGTSFTASTLSYACNANPDGGLESWPSLFASTGKSAPGSIATYSATGGTAPLYMAASGAVADIETQVTAALAAAKSCAFDLAQFSIDPSKLGEATVTLNGASLAHDAGVGWSMPTPTELVLNGPACVAWRTPAATIAFAFPCDTVLP